MNLGSIQDYSFLEPYIISKISRTYEHTEHKNVLTWVTFDNIELKCIRFRVPVRVVRVTYITTILADGRSTCFINKNTANAKSVKIASEKFTLYLDEV